MIHISALKDKRIQHLLQLMKLKDVKKIVISPGAKNSKLVKAFQQDGDFELYSVVDERSAAFFGIGLIQQSGSPVALCCTSGTAVQNYGSGVVEAYYQKLPLLVISSDRNSMLIGQMEDQTYPQGDVFTNFTKFHGELKPIATDLDEWYCNKVINEALIALNHHGRGPVHLNIPMVNLPDYNNGEVDDIRQIHFHDAEMEDEKWVRFGESLINKKIMVVIGQSVLISSELSESLEAFCNKFGAVILTDYLSHVNNTYTITNSNVVLHSISHTQIKEAQPDICITIGGNYIFNVELKQFLLPSNCQHWQVGKEGEICDPFQHLTEIFEMSETAFFNRMIHTISEVNNHEYLEWWKNLSILKEPSFDEFNEMCAVGALMKAIPEGSDLQLANSCTVRMAHCYCLKDNINVYCNRGINGIDGSMSTAVGFASASNRLTFYITGDLSFFYDMNSLSIRHIKNNLRILLLNNGGGAILYRLIPDRPDNIAAVHHSPAKGWAESLGFEYVSARTIDECEKGIQILTAQDSDKPVLMEVFTDISKDASALRKYYIEVDNDSELYRFISRVKNKIKKHL